MAPEVKESMAIKELVVGTIKKDTTTGTINTYTQTYSTADRTVANPTGVTMGDLGATSGGWGASSEANFDKITTAVDQLIADNLDLRQAITALIDDLQTLGVLA